MKLLIPLLLLIGFNVMGQDLQMFSQSGYVTDTVKCVMLVSDTARRYYATEKLIYDSSKSSGFALCCLLPDTLWREPNPITWWISGYVHRKRWHGMFLDWQDVSPEYIYLDDKKKPLPKNIIVWLSK